MSDLKLASIIREDAERVVLAIPDWSFLWGKRVLLTGGTGLIGIHMLAVLERLRHAGYVRHVTFTGQNLPTGAASIIGQFAEFVKCDLTNHAQMFNLPYDVDVIIHAAGYGQPGKFMVNGLKTIELNTTVTDDLGQHLAKDGRFLFLSTSEIYSGSKNIPYKEEDCGITHPFHPRACYIEGKRCGEAICNYHHIKGRHYRIARVSLAYGPGTQAGDERVINQFIQRALTEKVIKMRDLGDAIRTYCYVSDTVENLFNIILHGKEPLYNVGGKSRTTIHRLAEIIAVLTGARIELPSTSGAEQVMLKVLTGAPDDVWMDTSKANAEFSKTQYVPLDEGLNKTIEYQRILYANSGNGS